ncbi:MAG: hypothetical protein WC087_01510 [Candidatus Paceibacterota bacterium]
MNIIYSCLDDNGTNIEKEFEGHKVLFVHGYEALRDILLLSTEENPIADLILADHLISGNNDFPISTFHLLTLFQESFIRGFGVFIPKGCGYTPFSVTSASKSICYVSDCWLPDGRRGLQKLFLKVVAGFE